MKTICLHSPRLFLLAATLALAPCAGAAGSPSDLLEKAIYTEETKGDLDSAIAFYQQLVTEAKANQSIGAQAQLRLGLCLLKKGRLTEATAAFEKVVSDFPGEKELVAKAREHLPADLTLGPITWVDGERLHLDLTLASGIEVGAMETQANLVEVNGRKVWRVGRSMVGGGHSVSSVDVDPESFRPLTSYWKHTLLGEVAATFRPGEVEMQKTGAPDPTKVHLERTVFDNESWFHLLRRLPLALGYKTTINAFSSLTGGAIIPIGVEVVKKETLQVPAGKLECFKLQLSIGQTLWYSTDERRYLVQFEAGGAIGKLASIAQRALGAPVAFRDDELGISFNAPADWLVQRYHSGQPPKQTLIRTYDANADSAEGGLRLYATETLPAIARQSPRAWAESQFIGRKDVTIRANSWRNFSVSGRPAVSCVADYTVDGKPHTQYLAYALGAKTSEFFIISGPVEKFDALKAAFEIVLTSYRTTK